MNHQNIKARVIAFYLPQFHPIPENDKWWGKGFTEWTNVGKAKPLFKGHYQPRVPADLGYYDLRMPEVREAQAEMAREAGIEGFCYWHYWFGNGKQLLERPFNEVLASGKPDFPFCLGWANETWTNKSWEAGTRQMKLSVLMEQKYSLEDYEKHFYSVLPAFRDSRYIQVDGMPLFLVFRPLEIPDGRVFINLWKELAVKNGLKGIHFVGIKQNFDTSTKSIKRTLRRVLPDAAFEYKRVLDVGFDAVFVVIFLFVFLVDLRFLVLNKKKLISGCMFQKISLNISIRLYCQIGIVVLEVGKKPGFIQVALLNCLKSS